MDKAKYGLNARNHGVYETQKPDVRLNFIKSQPLYLFTSHITSLREATEKPRKCSHAVQASFGLAFRV